MGGEVGCGFVEDQHRGVLVLHDTVRADIGCGRPGASKEAGAAHAHNVITGLPEDDDTPVDPDSVSQPA